MLIQDTYAKDMWNNNNNIIIHRNQNNTIANRTRLNKATEYATLALQHRQGQNRAVPRIQTKSCGNTKQYMKYPQKQGNELSASGVCCQSNRVSATPVGGPSRTQTASAAIKPAAVKSDFGTHSGSMRRVLSGVEGWTHAGLLLAV